MQVQPCTQRITAQRAEPLPGQQWWHKQHSRQLPPLYRMQRCPQVCECRSPAGKAAASQHSTAQAVSRGQPTPHLVAHAVAVVDVKTQVVVAQAGAVLRLLAPHPLDLCQAGQLAQGQRAQVCGRWVLRGIKVRSATEQAQGQPGWSACPGTGGGWSGDDTQQMGMQRCRQSGQATQGAGATCFWTKRQLQADPFHSSPGSHERYLEEVCFTKNKQLTRVRDSTKTKQLTRVPEEVLGGEAAWQHIHHTHRHQHACRARERGSCNAQNKTHQPAGQTAGGYGSLSSRSKASAAAGRSNRNNHSLTIQPILLVEGAESGGGAAACLAWDGGQAGRQ